MPGGEKQVVLQSLQPDTRYSILVTAEYHNREGGSGSAQGKTSESNMQHFEKLQLVEDLILNGRKGHI